MLVAWCSGDSSDLGGDSEELEEQRSMMAVRHVERGEDVSVTERACGAFMHMHAFPLGAMLHTRSYIF